MTPKLSMGEHHRFSQLYLLHRVYHTPLFLNKVGLRDSPLCNRCHANPIA